MYQQLTTPPTDYWLLDCEFATGVAAKKNVNLPLEIALVHYQNGVKLSEFLYFLCWSEMQVCDLKRGLRHSGATLAEFEADGDVKKITAALRKVLGDTPLPIVGWNVEVDLKNLVKVNVLSKKLNWRYFEVDEFVKEQKRLAQPTKLVDEVKALKLPNLPRHYAMNDVVQTEAVFEYYLKHRSDQQMQYLVCGASGFNLDMQANKYLKQWVEQRTNELQHPLVQCTKLTEADFVICLGPTAPIEKSLLTPKIKQAQASRKLMFYLTVPPQKRPSHSFIHFIRRFKLWSKEK